MQTRAVQSVNSFLIIASVATHRCVGRQFIFHFTLAFRKWLDTIKDLTIWDMMSNNCNHCLCWTPRACLACLLRLRTKNNAVVDINLPTIFHFSEWFSHLSLQTTFWHLALLLTHTSEAPLPWLPSSDSFLLMNAANILQIKTITGNYEHPLLLALKSLTYHALMFCTASYNLNITAGKDFENCIII